jgi:hypothetical protein
VFFLDANSWQISSSRARREKQGCSRSERATRFHNPLQARLLRDFKKQRQHRAPGRRPAFFYYPCPSASSVVQSFLPQIR